MSEWRHIGENIFDGGVAMFLLRLVLVVLLTRLATRLLHRFLSRSAFRRQTEGVNKTSIGYLEQVVKAVLYLLAGMIILSGIKPLAMAARTVLGATSIVTVIIGLAAQQTFGNFIAGLSLAMTQPFQVGDLITVPEKDITGTVRQITFRHTVLQSLDGNNSVIVPNNMLNGAIVQNLQQSVGAYGVWLSVGVAYGTDIDKAEKILRQIVLEQKDTVNEDVPVRVTDLGASAVGLSCRVLTKTIRESNGACSAVRKMILKRFAEEGIEIPFNQLNVHVQS